MTQCTPAKDSLCNTLQRTATHCSTLQHNATHCNTLQHTATHGNILRTSKLFLAVFTPAFSAVAFSMEPLIFRNCFFSAALSSLSIVSSLNINVLFDACFFSPIYVRSEFVSIKALSRRWVLSDCSCLVAQYSFPFWCLLFPFHYFMPKNKSAFLNSVARSIIMSILIFFSPPRFQRAKKQETELQLPRIILGFYIFLKSKTHMNIPTKNC